MKIYPAFFLPEENGGFTVSFPDIPGAVTWGATFEEAYNYAQEVLGFALENEENGSASAA